MKTIRFKNISLQFVIFSVIIFSQIAKGQNLQDLVKVNPLTGSANVVIPIVALTNGQVSVPISIAYNTSNLKPKSIEGSAGMGWNLNAGGQISRQLRGLPDDRNIDNAGQIFYGWMNPGNTGADYASTFTINNNGTNCSLGATDITNINNNISYIYDTEPDIFYVSAPGLDCQLIYDRVASKFRTIDYRDLVINYTNNGGRSNNGSILSFTITNDKGIKYVFSALETITQNITPRSTPPNYLATTYKQFKNGVTYNNAWKLTSITDAYGNGFTFNYSVGVVRNSRDPIILQIGEDTTQSYQYSILNSYSPQILSSINKINAAKFNPFSVTFTWNVPSYQTETGKTYITNINFSGRNILFNYSKCLYTKGAYLRSFLKSIIDQGCGSPINYIFNYNAVNLISSTTTFPDSTSNQLDYWGYYTANASTSSLIPSICANPTLNGFPRYTINTNVTNANTPNNGVYSITFTGSNRTADSYNIGFGMLNKITNSEGGNTSITYEPNDYFDLAYGIVIQGGGLRVKQVINSTGNNSNNNIVYNYTYSNPAGTPNAGLSSGSPISLPQFAFTRPTNIPGKPTTWLNATVISATDLSNEDHTILYAYSRVSQTGAGSTLYNFANPATFWSTSASPVCNGCSTSEWSPTTNFVAYSCTADNALLNNMTYAYPFIPNTNYDFERGLPLKTLTYNDNGSLTSEIDYTYQRSSNPSSIIAFKAEDAPSTNQAKFYNQYKIFYNTNELLYTVTKKIFDTKGLSQAQTTTATYTYGSANHKLLTKITESNSNNSLFTTNFSYVKDYYPSINASNPQINAIYGLQQSNINSIVETNKQITKNGNTLTTAASLTLYGLNTYPINLNNYNTTITNYLPSSQLNWTQPNGAAFTPFSINTAAQTITYDSKYFVNSNFDKYDITSHLLTFDDNNKHFQTTFFDLLSGQITALFKNASYNEVAFNDFDSQFSPSVNTFTIGGTGSYTPPPGTGATHSGNCVSLAANTQTVTSSPITKNMAAQNYIFSIWITASNTGKLTFNGSTTNPVLSFNSGTAYYEIKVPASSLSTTFALGFTSNQNIIIDDVILYPDVAEVSTMNFDNIGYYKIAETNTNGISAYYTNDNWGRILYSYDQDHNITAKKQYISAADYINFPTPAIKAPSAIYYGVLTTFSNSNSYYCQTAGTTYIWDFGDGTAPVTSTYSDNIDHKYANKGNYTITLTANSPIFGSKSGSRAVMVTSLPQTKISYFNNCTDSYTGKQNSRIKTVSFLQGSKVAYSFSESDLKKGPSITPGVYTIQIFPSGLKYDSVDAPFGYLSISCYGGAQLGCWPYNYNATISFTTDLTSTSMLSLSIDPLACAVAP